MKGGGAIGIDIWLQGIPRSRRKEIKIVGAEESVGLPVSSSLGQKVTGVDMIPLSNFHGRGMTSFHGAGISERGRASMHDRK
jgi:hypothetical protein